MARTAETGRGGQGQCSYLKLCHPVMTLRRAGESRERLFDHLVSASLEPCVRAIHADKDLSRARTRFENDIGIKLNSQGSSQKKLCKHSFSFPLVARHKENPETMLLYPSSRGERVCV